MFMISLYNVLDWSELLYTDTDSVKFEIKYLKKMRATLSTWLVPHWKAVRSIDDRYGWTNVYERKKVFGSVEDELIKVWKRINGFITVQKKLWLCYDIDGKIIKCGTKSIKPSDVLLQRSDVCLFKILKYFRKIKITTDQTINELEAYYYNKLSRTEQWLNCGDNMLTMFRTIKNGGYATVLVS